MSTSFQPPLWHHALCSVVIGVLRGKQNRRVSRNARAVPEKSGERRAGDKKSRNTYFARDKRDREEPEERGKTSTYLQR